MSDAESTLARALADALPVAAFAVGPDGTLQWWNGQFEGVTGFDAAALADRALLDLVIDADAGRVAERLDAVREYGGTATPHTHVVTAGGEPRPVHLRASRLGDGPPGALAGVVRAEPRAPTSDTGDDADGTGDDWSERDPAVHERLVESAGDAVCAVDADCRLVVANQRFADLVDAPKSRFVGEPASVLRGDAGVDPAAWDASRAEIAALFDGDAAETTFEVLTAVDGENRVLEANAAAVSDGGETAGVVVVARDVTERARRERRMAARRGELRTAIRVNALVHEVMTALVTAASRDEIETTVCEHLQSAALYQSAWVGEPDPADDGIAVRTGVGVTGRALDQVAADASSSWCGPASRALATGEARVVDDLDADGVPEQVRDAAAARGVASVASVPLSHADTVYGVLSVGATRPDVFGDSDQSAFEVLGDVVGFAINAVQTRQLLLADATTRLEFETRDTRSVFVAASRAAACSLALDGMAPVGDGTLLCYATVSDAPPGAVVDAAVDERGVADARVVSERASDGVVEMTLAGDSLVAALTQRGAYVQTMNADRGSATLTVAVAPSVDVRSLVEQVQSTFDLRLAAKREVERSRRTGPDVRRALDDHLTERQRAAVRVAYHGGYFAWPRNSTAEELADAMDISSPTFHQHLRVAQRKLLSAFLDADA